MKFDEKGIGTSEKAIGAFATERMRAHLKRFCSEYRIPAREVYGAGGCDGGTALLAMIDHATRDLSMRLVHDVYSLGDSRKTIEFEASFTVPATWVDAFKQRFERWIPRLVLRRWPIKTKELCKRETRTVEAMALLPGVPVRSRDGIDIVFCVREDDHDPR